MALLTTTIGAYPKPDYVPTPDCNLGYLYRELALAKLTNMVSAAKSMGN